MADKEKDYLSELISAYRRQDITNTLKNLVPEKFDEFSALIDLAEKTHDEKYIDAGLDVLAEGMKQAQEVIWEKALAETFDTVSIESDNETGMVSIGSTPLLLFLKQIFNSGFRREVESINHNSKTEYTQYSGGKTRIERKTKTQYGPAKNPYNVYYILADDETLINPDSKRTAENSGKILSYLLKEIAQQGIPETVSIDLDKATKVLGYYDRSTTCRALNEFYLLQHKLLIGGLEYVPGQKDPENMEDGTIFYHRKRHGRYIEFSLDPFFDEFFFFHYFAFMPEWCFKLSGRAFSLAEYIFLMARMNTKKIKDNGGFNLSFSAIQSYLGLPAIKEITNRNYRGRILDPINDAIEKIEMAKADNSKPGDFNFTITPKIKDMDGETADKQTALTWLKDGYIEIGLSGVYVEKLMEFENKKEKSIDRARRQKEKEVARMQARKQIKAMEKSKRTGKKETNS